MSPIVIGYLPHLPVAQQQVELVERKGIGHPDSICDAIMEAIAEDLRRFLAADLQELDRVDVCLNTLNAPWLCSQIGQPVDRPWITAAHVILAPGASRTDVDTSIREIIHADLVALPSFITPLTQGAFPVW